MLFCCLVICWYFSIKFRPVLICCKLFSVALIFRRTCSHSLLMSTWLVITLYFILAFFIAHYCLLWFVAISCTNHSTNDPSVSCGFRLSWFWTVRQELSFIGFRVSSVIIFYKYLNNQKWMARIFFQTSIFIEALHSNKIILFSNFLG